jgi:hypothetical protein
MAKEQTVTYYAYADDLTKSWYFHNSPSVKVPNRYLLFEVVCVYSSEALTVDDIIPVVGGVYITAERLRIRVIERKWYGIVYQPAK